MKSQECGLCYQNIKAVKKPFGPEDRPFLDRSSTPAPRGTVFKYLIQRRGMKPETRIFSPKSQVEDDSFDGYRRVQVISQSISSFHTNRYPPGHFEAFRSFVELFAGAPADQLPFHKEMQQVHKRILEYSIHYNNMPPFSSFSRIKQWQQELAEELARLRQDVDQVFHGIYNSDKIMMLVQYLSKSNFTIHRSV